MLAKVHRLVKEQEFKKILSRGRSFYSPFFKIRYLPNNLGVLRAGIVISTKISKKATIRNRLKRQTREIIRLNLAKIKPGYDISVSLNTQAIGKTYSELEADFLANLSKIRLLV